MGAGQLYNLALEISKLFQEFCTDYLIEVIMQNIKYKEGNKYQIFVPVIKEINLPLIVSKDT